MKRTFIQGWKVSRISGAIHITVIVMAIGLGVYLFVDHVIWPAHITVGNAMSPANQAFLTPSDDRDSLARLEPKTISEFPDQISVPNELLKAPPDDNRTDLDLAHLAASAVISTIDAETILRWRIIVIDLSAIFKSSLVSDSGAGFLPRKPGQFIQLSPFNASSFVAENTSFVDNGWGASWGGQITEGGTGRVFIGVVLNDDNDSVTYINIVSDYGNFNVMPTSKLPYYVVMEASALPATRVH